MEKKALISLGNIMMHRAEENKTLETLRHFSFIRHFWVFFETREDTQNTCTGNFGDCSKGYNFHTGQADSG